MDVTIVDQPELRVAGIRHIGPYMEIGREFGRLGSFLKGPPPQGAQMIAIYHDDPDVTPADELRSDAGVTLPGHSHVATGLIEHQIPAGTYARTIHKGGYEGLPATWNSLKAWAKAKGHKTRQPGYEVYVNNPMTTAKEELLTEVYLGLD